MATPPKPTNEEIRLFAERYGLTKLSPQHLERMTELATYVADLGRDLPRPREKHVAPYTKNDSGQL